MKYCNMPATRRLSKCTLGNGSNQNRITEEKTNHPTNKVSAALSPLLPDKRQRVQTCRTFQMTSGDSVDAVLVDINF